MVGLDKRCKYIKNKNKKRCKLPKTAGCNMCFQHSKMTAEKPVECSSKPNYSSLNINKIKKLQEMVRAKQEYKKKLVSAVKTIETQVEKQKKINQYKRLQRARQTYKQTFKKINVVPETARTKNVQFKVNNNNINPDELIASFFNKNGRLIPRPIKLNDLNKSSYGRFNRHPVDWQLFGNRLTNFQVRRYEEHMLHLAMQQMRQEMKTKPSREELLSIYNNNEAREYTTKLFKNRKEYMSLEDFEYELKKRETKLNIEENDDIYIKYPKGFKPQYNLSEIKKQNIIKVEEPLRIRDNNNNIRTITRLNIIKKKDIYYNHRTFSRESRIYIKYIVYYGISERAKFTKTYNLILI